jgi:hypothetical protein
MKNLIYLSNLYKLLNTEGEIVIGACYIDNNRTEIENRRFVPQKTSNNNKRKDSFTATKEKFWSQRFTREKL